MKHLILLLGIFTLIQITACAPDPAQVSRAFESADPGIETVEDFEMIYSDSAVLKARITGPVMLHYMEIGNERDEFPEGVDVTFYGPGNEPQSWLTAKYAVRATTEQSVLMQDSVVLRNIKGEKLHTSELIWDESAGIVKTNKFAKITKVDGTEINCYGFISNEHFTDYTLLSIEGPVNVEALKE